MFSDSLLGKTGIYDIVEAIYNRYELKGEPFFGIFLFHKPALMVNDPELIKRIMVKDFSSFSNHHSGSDDHDPLGTFNLFTARSAVEAEMRAKLTPFYILDKISSNLIELINKKLDANGSVELDVKEFSGLYSTDVIASCAFGVEANSMENPEAEFRKVGRQLFELTIKRGLEFTSFFMLSEVTKFFNCKFFTESVTEFITKSITYVMGEREKSGITRNDLIDTLIEIKKSDGEMTMDMLIAQAALFFVAGY